MFSAEDKKMFEALEYVSKVDKKSIAMMAAQLAFKCKRCGSCCKDITGVMIRPEECRTVAKSFGMSLKNFIKIYTEKNRRSEEGFFLKGTLDQKICPFYDETAGCSIHEVRPIVCRVYPCANVIAKGQIELHFYANCPGCAELLDEIHATQMAPDINPVVGELKKSPKNMQLMEAIIFSESMELLEHYDKIIQKKIDDIRKSLKFSRLSEPKREKFRQVLVAYLSLVMPQDLSYKNPIRKG